MAMRQPKTDQLGETGQVAVVLFFDDLGWGPLPTNKHDLGTDLFVQVRRDDLTELGMLLGVQVKTGDSSFNEPTQVGGHAGWWFRETHQRHGDYWSNHHIPHILVIQDEARERRFWVRLDRTTIESTGVGIRVFVPESQVLTADAAEVWTDIVAEARKLQSFEGARWTFNITQVPESEWPRYALLASRITAPHPNQGFSNDINWAEAVALCLEADLQRWDHFASQRENVPTPAEARELEDPGWKFAAAIYSWLTGSSDELESLNTDEMATSLRVAHAICLSTVLTDRRDWDSAIALLRSLRDPSHVSVDQAWLAVHLGWVLFESGQISEARAAFGDSIAMHAAFPSSLTNSAIRAAGILALFDSAPAFSGDVAAAVQASDSTLSWWQTQKIENALNDFLRRSYQRWAHDGSTTFGGGDPTHNDLLSAELSARLVGNRRSSRYAAFLRAIANLTLPNGPHAKPEEQLELLRTSGYPKELALALHHLRSEGPLSQVSAYMTGVTVTQVTTTSMRADLESLEVAGAYLPTDVAEKWISYLLDAFDDPTSFQHRFNLSFEVRHDILDALVGLRLHFTETQERRLIQLALGLPEESTQLFEGSLSQMLRGLEPTILADRAAEISSRGLTLAPDTWLSRMFIDLTADRINESREVVGKRILSGNLATIPSSFSIDSLTFDEASALVAACALKFQEYQSQLNGVGFGGLDAYYLAARVAVLGPEQVRQIAWTAVVEGVTADDVIHDRKTNAVEFLATRTDAIPEEHRESLLRASDRLRNIPPSQFSGFDSLSLPPAGPAFAALYLELQPENDDWQSALSGLFAGTPHERRIGVDLLARRSGYELLLLAMTRDMDLDVAHSAMFGLARCAAKDSSIARTVSPRLLALVEGGGEQAALHVGRGIMAAGTWVPEIETLVTALQSHESLWIRKLAHDLEGQRFT